MDRPPSKIKHWEVISHPGSEPCYSWRCIGVDGTIIECSGAFETYGSVLVDAIRHGFKPETHHWIKISPHYAVHFGPDKLPVIVPPDGKPHPAPPRELLVGKPEPEKRGGTKPGKRSDQVTK
jgi:hypothetical protein